MNWNQRLGVALWAFSSCLAVFVSAEEQRGVAILPVPCLGAPDSDGARLQERLTQELRGLTPVRIQDPARVAQVVGEVCGAPNQWWGCLEEDQPLFQIGQKLGVEWVVSGKLAAMGGNRTIRMRVANCDQQTVSRELVELADRSEEPVVGKLINLFERLFPKRQELPRPWYRKWEIWTVTSVAVGFVVGGLVLATVVGQGSPSPGPNASHGEIVVGLP